VRRVSFEDIEILGHWCGAHIVKSYLTGMPLPACLLRAGHLEDACILPRSRIEPPEALMKQIFPDIDEPLAAFKEVSLSFCMVSNA
jgi:hypothetical protein